MVDWFMRLLLVYRLILLKLLSHKFLKFPTLLEHFPSIFLHFPFTEEFSEARAVGIRLLGFRRSVTCVTVITVTDRSACGLLSPTLVLVALPMNIEI